MKHFIACVLIFSCLMLLTSPANALDTSTDGELFIMHDVEKNNRIDELFAMRNLLELDFDENRETISSIDYELAQLGVETIPYSELQQKLGCDAAPNANVTSTSSTSWTSRRTVVTYRGKHYELQIIEGVPIDGEESPLVKNDAYVEFEAAGVEAGITEAVKILGASALGAVPHVGTALTIPSTLYSILKAGWDSMSTSTIIENVTGTALFTMSTHMKYIFVKEYDYSDQRQIISYIGTAVTYHYSTSVPYDVPGDGDPHPVHISYESERDVAYSMYYDDYYFATSNYYNARNQIGTDMIFIYSITRLHASVFGSNVSFNVPTEDAPLSN